MSPDCTDVRQSEVIGGKTMSALRKLRSAAREDPKAWIEVEARKLGST